MVGEEGRVAEMEDLVIIDVVALPLYLQDDVAGAAAGADEEVPQVEGAVGPVNFSRFAVEPGAWRPILRGAGAAPQEGGGWPLGGQTTRGRGPKEGV